MRRANNLAALREDTPKPNPVNVLPKDARDRLVAASQIDDPRARMLAVNDATVYARFHHPQFFNHKE